MKTGIIRLWITGVALLGMICIVKGQSIDTLVDTAKTNNPALKALDLEYKAALEMAPQANRFPDPEFGVGGFISPVETRLGAQRFRVSASQMVPWFGTLEAREDLALAKAGVKHETIESKAIDLTYQIKDAYYRLYQIEKSQLILRRNLVLLNSLRRLALSRIQSGKALASDVLRVDIDIQALEKELEILETQKVNPRAQINQVLNRELHTQVAVPDTLDFARLSIDTDTLIAHIRSRHPRFNLLEKEQEVSRKALALNRLEGLPSIGVGMDYIMVEPRTDAEPVFNGRDIYQVGVKVKIPIDREVFRAKAREENLRIEAIEQWKSNLETQFLSNVEQAIADYETARQRFSLYLQQKVTLDSAIRILEKNYSATGNNFDELLRLERDRIDYDLKILKAIVESHRALARIKLYIL